MDELIEKLTFKGYSQNEIWSLIIYKWGFYSMYVCDPPHYYTDEQRNRQRENYKEHQNKILSEALIEVDYMVK